MYSVKIQDENQNVLKDYRQDGVFVLGVEKADNMIILSRAVRDEETGALVPAPDDQIVNNKTRTTLKNKLEAVVTEKTETTYQTVLYKPGDLAKQNVKVTNPKEVVFEGSRDVKITNDDPLKRYYVYAKGKLFGIYTVASEAVADASSLYGVVTNRRMSYVWESTDRKDSARLTDLEITAHEGKADPETDSGTAEDDEEENETEEDIAEEETTEESVSPTIARCVDTMLQSAGVYKSSEEELRTKSIVRVLSDNLDADVLDLSGCSLSDVLYYPSNGTPVMAMTGDGGAVIIMGYDSKNTILYDPVQEKVYKYGMNDSKNLFEHAGNRYITYCR